MQDSSNLALHFLIAAPREADIKLRRDAKPAQQEIPQNLTGD